MSSNNENGSLPSRGNKKSQTIPRADSSGGGKENVNIVFEEGTGGEPEATPAPSNSSTSAPPSTPEQLNNGGSAVASDGMSNPGITSASTPPLPNGDSIPSRKTSNQTNRLSNPSRDRVEGSKKQVDPNKRLGEKNSEKAPKSEKNKSSEEKKLKKEGAPKQNKKPAPNQKPSSGNQGNPKKLANPITPKQPANKKTPDKKTSGLKKLSNQGKKLGGKFNNLAGKGGAAGLGGKLGEKNPFNKSKTSKEQDKTKETKKTKDTNKNDKKGSKKGEEGKLKSGLKAAAGVAEKALPPQLKAALTAARLAKRPAKIGCLAVLGLIFIPILGVILGSVGGTGDDNPLSIGNVRGNETLQSGVEVGSFDDRTFSIDNEELALSYVAAAEEHDLPWSVLAGMAGVATGHGKRSPYGDNGDVNSNFPEIQTARGANGIDGRGGGPFLLMDNKIIKPFEVSNNKTKGETKNYPEAIKQTAQLLADARDELYEEKQFGAAGISKKDLAADPFGLSYIRTRTADDEERRNVPTLIDGVVNPETLDLEFAPAPGTVSSGGNIQAHTRAARDFILAAWPEAKIVSDWRPVDGDGLSWHNRGLALDVGCGGLCSRAEKNLLDNITTWFVSNPQAFGLDYVIWRNKSLNSGGNWSQFADSPTGDVNFEHEDHVHLNFQGNPLSELGPLGNPWNGSSLEEVADDSFSYPGIPFREDDGTEDPGRETPAREEAPSQQNEDVVIDDNRIMDFWLEVIQRVPVDVDSVNLPVFFEEEEEEEDNSTEGSFSTGGAPSIIGGPLIPEEQMVAYLKGRPVWGLDVTQEEVVRQYYENGLRENIRPDWAIAQVVEETGLDTERLRLDFNFAGIGHCNSCPRGVQYASLEDGIRSHIIVLKRVALGNDVPLVGPEALDRNGGDVRWLADQLSYWDEMSGVWAQGPGSEEYYCRVSAIAREAGAWWPVGESDQSCGRTPEDFPRPDGAVEVETNPGRGENRSSSNAATVTQVSSQNSSPSAANRSSGRTDRDLLVRQLAWSSRWIESDNDYEQAIGCYRGAYQYGYFTGEGCHDTWGSYGGYPRPELAPKPTQDEKKFADLEARLTEFEDLPEAEQVKSTIKYHLCPESARGADTDVCRDGTTNPDMGTYYACQAVLLNALPGQEDKYPYAFTGMQSQGPPLEQYEAGCRARVERALQDPDLPGGSPGGAQEEEESTDLRVNRQELFAKHAIARAAEYSGRGDQIRIALGLQNPDAIFGEDGEDGDRIPGATYFDGDLAVSSDGYAWPTTGAFTSGFGPRGGSNHDGVDISGAAHNNPGPEIWASRPGTVKYVHTDCPGLDAVRGCGRPSFEGYGNIVFIDHGDNEFTLYAHFNEVHPSIREGVSVERGQILGGQGNSGHSGGTHLHFEIRKGEFGAVNPIPLLPEMSFLG